MAKENGRNISWLKRNCNQMKITYYLSNDIRQDSVKTIAIKSWLSTRVKMHCFASRGLTTIPHGYLEDIP